MSQILFEHRLETVEDSAPRFQMGMELSKGLYLQSLSKAFQFASFIFPRRGSRFSVNVDKSTEMNATSSQMLYIPPDTKYMITGVSVLSRCFTIHSSAELFEEMKVENRLSKPLHKDLQKPIALRLSRWMDDLIDRYYFERVENDESPVGCPQFLEKQIMNEFVRLRFPSHTKTTGNLIGKDVPSEIETLVEWIETHLFEEIDIATVAKAVGLSESQVHRIFISRLGLTPMAFVYGQRLEEAARLIERAELSLTDIANIVGFSDLSTFSRAFKKKFGVTPGKYASNQFVL